MTTATVLEGLLARWELVAAGPLRPGGSAVVLPVRDRDGAPAALKVGPTGSQEHLALRHWAGAGAVRLLRADPARGAVLMEQAGPAMLSQRPVAQSCEVLAGLYGVLHVPAPPSLRRLDDWARGCAETLAALPRDAPVPRRLVEQATALASGFADDPATTGTLVHTDLHDAHVLAGVRAPWLAVGPDPLDGDPHVEPAPVLWTRWEEAAVDGDVRSALRRRFHTLVDVAGLEEERARDWVVVRAVHRAVRALAGPGEPHQHVTRCVSIAKAVQD